MADEKNNKINEDEIKELEEIKKELDLCKKEKEEYLEGWKRERANFENFRKDEEKRFLEFANNARKKFALKLLPILDNLEFSEKYLTEDDKKNNTIKGFMEVKKQIEQLMKELGVEEINVKEGDKFSEYLHEAIEKKQSEDYKEIVVIEVLQKGYYINKEVLRPAKVKVGIPKQ